MGAKAWGGCGERLRTGWIAPRSGVEWSGDEVDVGSRVKQGEAKRGAVYLPTYLPPYPLSQDSHLSTPFRFIAPSYSGCPSTLSPSVLPPPRCFDPFARTTYLVLCTYTRLRGGTHASLPRHFSYYLDVTYPTYLYTQSNFHDRFIDS